MSTQGHGQDICVPFAQVVHLYRVRDLLSRSPNLDLGSAADLDSCLLWRSNQPGDAPLEDLLASCAVVDAFKPKGEVYGPVWEAGTDDQASRPVRRGFRSVVPGRPGDVLAGGSHSDHVRVDLVVCASLASDCDSQVGVQGALTVQRPAWRIIGHITGLEMVLEIDLGCRQAASSIPKGDVLSTQKEPASVVEIVGKGSRGADVSGGILRGRPDDQVIPLKEICLGHIGRCAMDIGDQMQIVPVAQVLQRPFIGCPLAVIVPGPAVHE